MPTRNTVEIVIKGDDQASGVLDGIGGRLKTLGNVAMVGIGALTAAAAAGGAALFKMAADASSLEGIKEAFTGIATGAGKSTAELIAAMEKGSAGMASQRDLMLSYNKAAQLVNTTFANELPDAMGYLSKVSSATGQDMGFLIDSLVTGVGRLSPMILDNLAIQVDLTAAYDDYAASIGKSADALTKGEKQTALMAQVMEKLKTNTADLPDVAGQADTMYAQLQARLVNLKDSIGMKVLPVFSKFVEFFIMIVEKVGPPLIDFIGNVIVPVLNSLFNVVSLLADGNFVSGGFFGLDEDHPIASFFLLLGRAFDAIAEGVPIFHVLGAFLAQLGTDMIGYGDGWEILGQILMGMHNIVVAILVPIGEWISQNIQLSDILTALGIVLAIVILPVLVSIALAVLPLLLLFGALVLGIALLRQAWETDFGGIRTFVQTQLLPAVQQFFDWLTLVALPAVSNFITTTVVPAVQGFMDLLAGIWLAVQPHLQSLFDWFTITALPAIIDFITTTVVPGVQGFIDLIMGIWAAVQPTLQSLFDWFMTTGLPAIKNFIETGVMPVIQGIVDLLGGLWSVVEPALKALYDWFITNGLPAIQSALQWFYDNVLKPVGDFLGGVLSGLSEIGNSVGGFFSGVGDGLNNIGQGVSDFFNGGNSGGYAGGTRSIPRDGMYKLHAGESVATRQETNMNQGDSAVHIHFEGSGGPRDEAEADDMGYMTVNAMRARGLGA